MFRGIRKGAMKGFFDYNTWVEWIRSQDDAWLFLLVLVLVIAVVVVWSSTLRPDNNKEPEDKESRT